MPLLHWVTQKVLGYPFLNQKKGKKKNNNTVYLGTIPREKTQIFWFLWLLKAYWRRSFALQKKKKKKKQEKREIMAKVGHVFFVRWKSDSHIAMRLIFPPSANYLLLYKTCDLWASSTNASIRLISLNEFFWCLVIFFW